MKHQESHPLLALQVELDTRPLTSVHSGFYMQTATLPMTATSTIRPISRFTRTSVEPMWKDTTVTTNADGQEEAYVIAPDGFIWSYTIDSELGRTGRLITTGLRASAFVLGKSPDGRNIVIAADGVLVHFAVETGDFNQRWSTPRAVNFSAAQPKMLAIEKLFTQVLAGHLFVGVLARHRSPEGDDPHQFWEAIWAGADMVFSPSPLKIECQKNTWMAQLETALF